MDDRELAIIELINAAKKAADSCFALGMQYASPLANSEQRHSAMREHAKIQVQFDIAIQAIRKTAQPRKAKATR